MDKPYPRAVLFDLDNTILADDASAQQSWQQVCADYAPNLAVSSDDLFRAIEETRRRFWNDTANSDINRLNLHKATREVVAIALGMMGLNSPEIGQRIAEDYRTRREETVEPFPGAIEALYKFGAKGIRLGLVTNGETVTQRNKIKKFQLELYFDYILIEGEFGVGKPDHRVFLHSLDTLGIKSGDAWMVGDHLHYDIAPAMELGLLGIWVDWAGTGLPEDAPIKPDGVIGNIAELI